MRKRLLVAPIFVAASMLAPGAASAQAEPLPPLPPSPSPPPPAPPPPAPPSGGPEPQPAPYYGNPAYSPPPNGPPPYGPPPYGPPPYAPPPYGPQPYGPPPYNPSRPLIIHRCGEASGEYCHDGFYMRFGLGLAYTSLVGNGPVGNASVSGVGVALSAAFGGTVARGLVLGGAVRVADGVGPFTGSPLQATGNATGSLVQVGVFVDWYPAPAEGWHVGGQGGVGVTDLTDSTRTESSGGGVAFSLFGGYDWWIGPQWSLGLLMSLSTATATALSDSWGNPTGYTFTPLAFGLEANVLWH